MMPGLLPPEDGHSSSGPYSAPDNGMSSVYDLIFNTVAQVSEIFYFLI